MKKFYKPFIKFFAPLAIAYWCWWSNIRFRKKIRTDTTLLLDEDRVSTLAEIKKLATKAYRRFKWTEDGPDVLWDAISPPPQAYKYYSDGLLEEDCDGFHALMHYCLSMNGIKSYLFTVTAIGSSHCILLFYFQNKWHVNDYYNVYGPYDTVKEAVEAYNLIFADRYKTESEVFSNQYVDYNYKTGKFKRTTRTKIEAEQLKSEEKK